MNEQVPKIIIWGDGGGSTANVVLEKIHEGEVSIDVVGIITTDPNAGILEKAARANRDFGMDIETFVVPGKAGRRQDEATQCSILEFMERKEATTLALLGALVIMGKVLVTALNGEDIPEPDLPRTLDEAKKIMVPSDDGFGYYLPEDFPHIEEDSGRYGLPNTHPAPTIVTANTHGQESQERLLQLESLVAGQTFHAVGHGIDTGPIFAFNPIDVPHELLLQAKKGPEELEAASEELFSLVQKNAEKPNIAYDLEIQAKKRHEYVMAA